MEIAIVVEPHGGGWRARCRHPVEASATGASRFDATSALEAALCAATGGPVTLLPLEVTPDKPWIASAGSIPDDETTDAWLDAIADNRRQRDADEQAALAQPQPNPCREPVRLRYRHAHALRADDPAVIRNVMLHTHPRNCLPVSGGWSARSASGRLAAQFVTRS
jgi:hypothetical protein